MLKQFYRKYRPVHPLFCKILSSFIYNKFYQWKKKTHQSVLHVVYMAWLKGGWEEEGMYSWNLGASLIQENAASTHSNCSNLISQDCFHSDRVCYLPKGPKQPKTRNILPTQLHRFQKPRPHKYRNLVECRKRTLLVKTRAGDLCFLAILSSWFNKKRADSVSLL